eukprot:scaffold151316_cov71-Cyclotella_meneghiniana.AAC.6
MEEILNGMAHKDPSQWEPTEWIIFILFMSLFACAVVDEVVAVTYWDGCSVGSFAAEVDRM